MAVLDVGANVGRFGLEVAKQNPDVHVHLIEPIPELVTGMRNATKGRFKNVSIHELAITTKVEGGG